MYNLKEFATWSQIGGNMYNTEKKELLLNIFKTNKDRSFSATTLVTDLKDSINKATIYRQLKMLEEKAIIRKTYNNETNSYEYQYATNCREHLHLKCEKCGNIIHLSCKEANLFINHILKNHGFCIDQYSSNITGICKECMQKC